MLFTQTEHFFNCPYCYAEISILIEPLGERQQYIEDCEVCCNPIQFTVAIENGELTDFSAANLDE